jgi:hypothetical protein
MKRDTQFHALPSNPDDEPSSLELSNMRTQSYRDEPRQWNAEQHKATQAPTLRQKLAHFPWRVFFTFWLLPLALAPIIVLATVAEEASVGYLSKRTCYPNGMWSEAPGATWRIMDSSYFFTPNLSFGNMSFTAAKTIDIFWDLVVGRGGQMLLAWVNYRVFNEWLIYHMEQHLTSYKMFTALAFNATSLGTLGVLGKEFLSFGGRSWRRFFRWLGVLCMCLSTIYVLSFPTLMSAMTGYITTYDAYVGDSLHNLIDLHAFRWLAFGIEDAHRIGDFTQPLLVTYDDTSLLETTLDCTFSPNIVKNRTYVPTQTF